MESRQDTPIFVWPDLQGKKMEGETYDFINGYHVYPKSRVAPESQNREQITTAQDLYGIQQKVEAVFKVLPQHNGNILPWIINDLAKFASTKERDMLPKLDYANPIFWYNISEECKSMLYSKISRAQIHRAHDLALFSRVDIAITWYAGPDPETAQRVVESTPEQAEVMKRAWDNNFGTLDGDLMHRKPRPRSPLTKLRSMTFDDMNRDPRWVSHEEDLSEPECQGGFYSCIRLDQLPALLALQQPPWNVEITTLISPQSMTFEQQEEMKEYDEARRQMKREAVEKRKEWEKVHRGEVERCKEMRTVERKNDTYERTLQRSREMRRCLDIMVNHYEGEECKEGCDTTGHGRYSPSFMRLT